MFTSSHHHQPLPLENEEEDTTLSTILIRVLLELKKSIGMEEEFAFFIYSNSCFDLHSFFLA